MEPNYKYKTIRVTSSALRFTIKVNPLPTTSAYPEIFLSAGDCPHGILYKVCFDYLNKKIIFKVGDINEKTIELPSFLLSLQPHEIWASWYNNRFQLGSVNNGALLEYQNKTQRKTDPIDTGPTVGFITFKYLENVTFETKETQISLENIYKHIDGGELRWVLMTSGDQLPFDALIAGFQEEPIYIARAKHRGSLCPGKYVPSKQLAFLPWGHQEHRKSEFEVLCGYNAMWIKCRSPYLPSNVYVAGKSEVGRESLYIGRAMINNELVVGKVHMLYQTCYLPNQGKEVERRVFEVLAVGNSDTSEYNWKKQCFMADCKPLCP
ncbi:uncharacterized protein LOC116779132 isoform X2 [Danaus plexippus]|nr:uncharacterized protein LOC116779132 isoform X2 [Danaus plexippus]XP_061385622.1 uncharacterized protein LOC116779132 isoform X2 [Danaus plexippus]XP_061385623.1 uncharacterized protein LOC116779132 isoform X2 [Danaus plexippus]XP_061385624.1 uncharacterized protein LOC116779132 isoform X2 [Danaus plexippus]